MCFEFIGGQVEYFVDCVVVLVDVGEFGGECDVGDWYVGVDEEYLGGVCVVGVGECEWFSVEF